MNPKVSSWWYSAVRRNPHLTAVVCGLILAASFPPVPAYLLALVGFVPLLLLAEALPESAPEDLFYFRLKRIVYPLWAVLTLRFVWKKDFRWIPVRRNISRAAQFFRYFYTATFIWNLLTCYWLSLTALSAANVTEGITSSVAGFLAVVLNPFLMAIPWQIYLRIRSRMGLGRSLLAWGSLWITFEYLHFQWDLSWSWVTIGHAFTFIPWYIQYAEWTGVFGISAFILAANALVMGFLNTDVRRIRQYYLAGLAVLLVFPLILYPILTNPNREMLRADTAQQVLIIQPNINPYYKFEPLSKRQQIEKFSALIAAAHPDTGTLVFLPETAVPTAVWTDEMQTFELLNPLWQLVDSFRISIITGITELKFIPPGQRIPASAQPTTGGFFEYYNAAVLLEPGKFPVTYQKSKHVPLVERMPFLEQLQFLKGMSIDLGGGFGSYGVPDSCFPLRSGSGVATGVMICYESEYPSVPREMVSRGAGLLSVITNDGWWKQSSGYIQHAGLSVLRAIETRRDIARSANTGRSQVVLATGDVRYETNWWEEAVIHDTLSVRSGTTFYVRFGDWIAWLSIVISIAMVLVTMFRYIQKRNPHAPSTQQPAGGI